MEIYKKLFDLQQSFKSVKDCRNNFGNYNYRNAEQMLSTLKPMLNEKGLVLLFKEELVDCGYMKCTATLIDMVDGEKVETSSIAKIDTELKGMSYSQMSGCTISYLRKYTMGGLFSVDDGKDPDSLEPQQPKKTKEKYISIIDEINECNSKEELKALWTRLGNYTKNETIKKAFTERKEML